MHATWNNSASCRKNGPGWVAAQRLREKGRAHTQQACTHRAVVKLALAGVRSELVDDACLHPVLVCKQDRLRRALLPRKRIPASAYA